MKYISFFLFLFSSILIIYPANNLKSKPTEVAVGMYINHIDNIDVANQTFYAEIYLNLKWKGTRSAKRFEFYNNNKIERYYYEEWRDRDTNWITCKIKGTFRCEMDVTNYPFDKHTLKISMSDYDWTADSLIYKVNKEISGMSMGLLSEDWNIKNHYAEIIELKDFGDKFSVIQYKIYVSRKPGSFIIKILIPILIVMGVAFLNLFLPKKEIESCIALGITSLLSIIALHFTISSKLPDVDYATKIDVMMMGSYFLIFISIVDVVTVFNLHNTRRTLSKNIDKWAKIVVPIFYITFIIMLLIW